MGAPMGSAVAKAADGKAVGNRIRANVVDALPDQLTVTIPITDALLGALLRGRVDHIKASFVGADVRRFIDGSADQPAPDLKVVSA